MPNYKVFTNDKDLVKVGSTYCGKPVWGYARCSGDDEFDFAFGYELAKARCDMKIAKLRRKRAQKQLKDGQDLLTLVQQYIQEKADYVEDSLAAERMAKIILEDIEATCPSK